MTVKELKQLLNNLPDDTLILKTEGDFYALVGTVEINKMYKLTEEQKKSCYGFSTRNYMTVDRWFDKKDKYDVQDPQIFEALLIK